MEITLTPAEIVAVCVGFAAICTALSWAHKAIAAVRKPEMTQNERLTAIESRLAKHDELLDRDKVRLDTIEEGTRVTQRAILALLSHGIDGNDVDAMRTARDELQKFLINR